MFRTSLSTRSSVCNALRIADRFLMLLIVASLLQGCAGFKLYDADKAKMASTLKEQYSKLKAVDIVDAEARNLDKLLSEELDVVRKNKALDRDIALLEIANNDTPMARTLVTYSQPRIHDLTPSALKFHDPKIDLDKTVQNIARAKSILEKGIEGKKLQIPACPDSDALPSAEKVIPQDISSEDAAEMKTIYDEYIELCNKQKKLKEQVAKFRGKTLRDADDKAGKAVNELEKRKSDAKTAANEVVKAKDAYDAALADVAKASNAQKVPDSKELQDKANDLLKQLDKFKGLDSGLEHREAIQAIAQLLTAAATGTVDTSDPEMRKALVVASRLPVLSGDIKAILEANAAPVVTHLLVTMRHQMVLAEHARRRIGLAERDVALLQELYETYVNESKSWLEFTTSVCQFDHRLNNPKATSNRTNCDSFRIELTKDKDPLYQCRLNDKPVSPCALEKSWKQHIAAARENKLSQDAARELYKTLAHYVAALKQQVIPYEINLRRTDLRHRETLLAQKSALQAWDNLIGVPIEQLDAYYQAGVKPAEIADLIVKALGFTAIAIGVAR